MGTFLGVDDDQGLAGVAIITGISGGNARSVSRFRVEGLTVRELSRFAMRDDCPKNSESRFLGQLLRLLRRRGIDLLLAYADPAAGHKGTIYRASNWIYLGLSAKGRNDDFKVNGHRITSTSLRKVSSKLGERRRFLERLYGDRLEVNRRGPKHIYIYLLTRRAKKSSRVQDIVLVRERVWARCCKCGAIDWHEKLPVPVGSEE